MMHMGLQLLTVALESGHVANYQSLLVLVKDELCRHLLEVPGVEDISMFLRGSEMILLAWLRGHLSVLTVLIG